MLTTENGDVIRSIDTYDWIIYLAGEWEQFWKRHLIRELARRLHNSRILCIARPMCLLSGPLCHPKEFLAWLKQPGGITTLDDNLLLFRPGIFLHDHLAGHVPLAERINRNWLRHQLHTAVARAGLRSQRLIAFIYDPFQIEYLNLVRELFSVYYIYDLYTAWPEVPLLRTRSQVEKKEGEILRKVDLVLVLSEMLRRRLEKLHKRVHLVPMAVDTQHFGRAAASRVEIAPDLAMISHPIVGYLGNINSRIDFDLLKHLARSRPDWSLVLIGGISQRGFFIPSSLTQLSNVHFIGACSYESLPVHLKAFDVCIIPYLPDDPFNINCFPAKLFEYMATSKPIVSTDLPAVRPFNGLVRIAQDVDEFCRQVAEAVEERDDGLRQRRLALAQKNSWEKRAEYVLEIINASLNENSP